jgi:hypothetical protein
MDPALSGIPRESLGGLNFGSNLIDVLLRLRARLNRLHPRENRMALCGGRDR